MSPEYITNATSWQEADEHFERFVAALPERREQLRRRIAETGGPALDGTIEGLDPLNEWYIATALADQPDGMTWLPEWVTGAGSTQRGFYGERPCSGPVLRLWEMIGIYLGDLALARFPESRWVCWRDSVRSGVYNGEPVVDVGLPDFPLDVLSVANAAVPRTYMYAGTGHRHEEPADPTRLRRVFTGRLERTTTHLAAEAPRWQRAPTGPDARRRTKKRPF